MNCLSSGINMLVWGSSVPLLSERTWDRPPLEVPALHTLRLARFCSPVFSCNPRITAVRCCLSESNDLVLGSVYFPMTVVQLIILLNLRIQ